MARPLRIVVPVVLVFLAAVAGVLIVLGSEGDGSASLESVTTVDGVVVDVPAGWVVSDDFDFQYVPPVEDDNLVDIWAVAWACPPEGCAARSLAEWQELAPDLPTFASAREEENISLFDVEETNDARSWVLTARTENDVQIVNVAVFHDGADHYLACNLAVLGEARGLDDAVVDACLDATVPT